MQVRTQAGLVETIPMEYLHHGRTRVVSTPFEIDNNIHIRVAVDGRPYDPLVRMKADWEQLERTAPDAETLWGHLALEAMQIHQLAHDPAEIERWKKPIESASKPKWLQEAEEVWHSTGRL